MRKQTPRHLDKFAASPVGDKKEFERAYAAIQRAHPELNLGYVGTDGKLHYFQVRDDPIAYTVPVSAGWTP
jgi:hypothetical protein